MNNFLEVDYFADISDVVMNDLQRRLLRDNENDATIIKATYSAHVTREYAESFWLDADEAAGLAIQDDGSATGGGRRFSGAPSLSVFIEYIRKGRQT